MFQEHYSTLPEFQSSRKNIALIGTISQGLCYVGAPLSAAITKRWPKHQRHLIWLGWPLCILSLALGSLTTEISILVLTQGVMYGLGFVTLYWPIMSMVNEWWVLRKGFAFGIVTSAGGAAGAVLPFVFQALLDRYGYKITLRATAVGMVLLTGPLIPFFKARLPASEQSTLARMNWSFVKNPLSWVYCLATIVQGLGFFFPPLYLPSFATDIGLSSTMGALLLSVMAIAQFVGQFSVGYLSDKKLSVSLLAMTCSIMTTLAAFLLWGMATSLPILLIFSIVYGFFGYGFGTMRVAMGKSVTKDPSSVVAIQAILVFCLGVGNILVGPISAELIHSGVIVGEYGADKYKEVVIFTGSCMLGSVLVLAIPWFGPRQLWTAVDR